MKLASIEHSRSTYFADFAIYLAAVMGLPWVLFALAPQPIRGRLVLAALAGLAVWSLVEYAMHRLLFHGVEPFQRLHDEHHRRPNALIATPTAVSLAMIAGLFWLPASLLAGRWVGAAATLGLTAGYLVYGVLHHALHHWRVRSVWMLNCKRMHAIHHHAPRRNFGVTMPWWDWVFRSLKER
jgi:sterol desaturase/sphingolipid hydroxylase (fatty acid hydroxylase superfamily)